VLDDALAQGFQRLIMTELVSMAAKAYSERKNAPLPTTRKGRGAPRKQERADAPEYKVNVEELAQIALFAHRNGLEVTPKLAKKLLALKAHLPVKAAKELEFILHLHDGEESEEDTAAEAATRPRRTAVAGSRWGDLYLEPVKQED
jgi:hypothetical protein